MSFSHGESIALWTGVILFVVFLTCIFWRLISVTCKTMIVTVTGQGRSRRKRMNPREERVNKILSNESAREILKAHALTAINSQANKRKQGYSSQMSLDSIGTVPDLTDRVIRVSFAPTGESSQAAAASGVAAAGTESNDNNPGDDQVSVSTMSIGNLSQPPAYDTLSTHSRVSASDPPPEYQSDNENHDKNEPV